MTHVNYNDGKWHGWNGGECPVHPLSTVECRVANAGDTVNGAHMEARCWHWNLARDVPSAIIAFRVIKEHREPREWWIGYGDVAWFSRDIAVQSFGKSGGNPVHVREVLE